jgi:glycogen(starch) synthase
MKVAMTTVPFCPQVGGVETVVSLLAKELVRIGCEVKVVTSTLSTLTDHYDFEVIRAPNHFELLRVYFWADLYLQHGPSLKFGWPVFLCSKTAAIVHHIWMNHTEGVSGVGWLRRQLLRRCRNLVVSTVLGESLPTPSERVFNPYDNELFEIMPQIARDRDLIFVGRLIKEKGADLILESLDKLQRRRQRPNLTIVGEGPELPGLRDLVMQHGLEQSVRFLGAHSGTDLARELNRHKIMIVPSRGMEAFGIVALEGIACGCAVIGSDGGGLPEAIGKCGLLFPSGDSDGLAGRIESLLLSPDTVLGFRDFANTHLQRHVPSSVVLQYLALFSSSESFKPWGEAVMRRGK